MLFLDIIGHDPTQVILANLANVELEFFNLVKALSVVNCKICQTYQHVYLARALFLLSRPNEDSVILFGIARTSSVV
jgi:hypothetical protein